MKRLEALVLALLLSLILVACVGDPVRIQGKITSVTTIEDAAGKSITLHVSDVKFVEGLECKYSPSEGDKIYISNVPPDRDYRVGDSVTARCTCRSEIIEFPDCEIQP